MFNFSPNETSSQKKKQKGSEDVVDVPKIRRTPPPNRRFMLILHCEDGSSDDGSLVRGNGVGDGKRHARDALRGMTAR